MYVPSVLAWHIQKVLSTQYRRTQSTLPGFYFSLKTMDVQTLIGKEVTVPCSTWGDAAEVIFDGLVDDWRTGDTVGEISKVCGKLGTVKVEKMKFEVFFPLLKQKYVVGAQYLLDYCEEIPIPLQRAMKAGLEGNMKKKASKRLKSISVFIF